MEEKVFFKNKENLKLCGVLHGSASRGDICAIVCHGFAGDKDRSFIPELACGLEGQGFLALRFDFSGNGESEGLFEDRTWAKYS
jgi:alpha/beta superfamily hydrolase